MSHTTEHLDWKVQAARGNVRQKEASRSIQSKPPDLVKKRETRTTRLVDSAHNCATSGRQSIQLITDGFGHEGVQTTGGLVCKNY